MEIGCTLVHYVYSAREFLTTNHLYVALILCDLHSSFQYVQYVQYVVCDDHAKCRTCWLQQLPEAQGGI